ncbi:amidohydrolase [Tunicatimonas pelagia]|uniref:amidohydrolase n=1 Tax=Tunicatimonas pelagia TaxID=931531 RepID=UPI003F5421E0
MNLSLRSYPLSKSYFNLLVLTICFLFYVEAVAQKKMSGKQIEKLKEEAALAVEKNSKLTQVMVDKIFSFSELGFQEVETSKYITGILEENGFTIERGISGVPTAWTATWGSGKPVIAIGSDLDCIPKASQKPGVAYHDPIIEGAPGHGEGHNSGQAVNVTAVLAVKEIMEREGFSGTLMLWPGVAEEQVATKAFFVRDGYFDDVDACIFTHVGNNLETSYGSPRGNGMISVEFTFDGEAAHGAGSPWRGRSSLDAVELMNVGWNFRREHLQPTQRSHYVITDGGDQPNVVPAKASVWYYLRDRTYADIKKMYDIAINIAKGAALMTDTEMSYRYLGSAWPGHFNKVIAETAHRNIEKVGLPEWSEKDQTLAKAVQEEVGSDPEGLATELEELGLPVKFSLGGGSDDIADISWAVPTIVLRFPSNMPGLQGHHWSNAITMATPIAHKGATAGAKAEAMTLLDLFLNPELIEQAWDYYKNEQTKNVAYEPLLNPDDKPAIELNTEIMSTFRPELEKYYFDETKYDNYLEQLGITYPTLRSDAASVGSESGGK